MKNTTVIGNHGEHIACQYLLNQGYQILKTNYRLRGGEIDIICIDNKYLVFVEVKCRKSSRYGTPSSYVTSKKQQKIIQTAQIFLMETPTELQPRFDVIEVVLNQVNHIENAFEVG